MGRAPCCDKIGLKKGPWTPEEDQKLIAYIQQHGHGSWRALPIKAGLLRCGKSCRLRWANYLRPDIKRGKFSPHEEQTIIQLHALLGNRWSAIATHLPKRTDNEIKNYWNTHLKKRLLSMGIDPVTHRPRTETLSIASPHVGGSLPTTLSHMAQWESARLEAEARLVRESRLRANGLWPPPKPHNTATSFFNVLKPSPESPWPTANKLENATANTEPSFTSFLALLQQAMSCPPDMKKPKVEEKTEDSKKNSEGDFKPEVTWYDNVTTTKGASNNEAASSATAASDISELSKPENTSMVLSDFHLHSDEITSSNSGFSADSLLEFVVNEEEEERNVGGGGEEDYWGNMFNLCCNSPPSSGF